MQTWGHGDHHTAHPGQRRQAGLARADELIGRLPSRQPELFYETDSVLAVHVTWCPAKIRLTYLANRPCTQFCCERQYLFFLRFAENCILDQEIGQPIIVTIKVGHGHFQRQCKFLGSSKWWLMDACFISTDSGTAAAFVHPDDNPQFILSNTSATTCFAQASAE